MTMPRTFQVAHPGDGSDATAAIREAVAAASAWAAANQAPIAGAGGLVVLPPGVYGVSGTIRIAQHRVSIMGTGPMATVLQRTGDFGDTITIMGLEGERLYGCCLRDLTMVAATEDVSHGAHVRAVNSSQFDFTDLQLLGHFGGIDLAGCQTAKLRGLNLMTDYQGVWQSFKAGSYLLRLRGANLPDEVPQGYPPCAEITVSDFHLRTGRGMGAEALLDNGIVLMNADGIYFSQGHINQYRSYGIVTMPEGPEASVQSITFAGVHVDGDHLVSGWGVATLAPLGGVVRSLSFANCIVTSPIQCGYHLSDVSGVAITGGSVAYCPGYGIYVGPTASDVVICGARLQGSPALWGNCTQYGNIIT